MSYLKYNGKMIISTVSGGKYLINGSSQPSYPSVQIGTQIWMSRNIDDSIPGSRVYANNEANRAIYGGLYNYDLIDEIEALYPGWRVPTYDDFVTLALFVGGVSSGGKLKEIGTTHWTSPNTGATDDYGFTALPGGSFSVSYSNLGTYTLFQTKTIATPGYANTITLNNSSTTIGFGSNSFSNYHSVRLIKN